MLQDLGLADHVPGAQGELLQHRELLGGEGVLVLTAVDASGGGVDAKGADGQDGRGGAGPTPAQQGADPGDEDDVAEGLGQVVVRAGVEPLGLVVLAVLGGQHEDRHLVSGGAQGTADPVAVHAGQHDVEDHQVVAALARPVQPLEAVVHDIHGEALGGESPGEGHRETLLVLHDQQAHAHSLANST
ncbi:hypothetical protein SMICM17S_02541 [Streptomyces microflavus]